MLNADGMQVFHDPHTHVALEDGGQVFLVVFQITAQKLQGEIRIGEMLVHVLLDQGDQVCPSLVVGSKARKPSTQIGKGVEQDSLAGDIRQLCGGAQALGPDRSQLAASFDFGILRGDLQLVHNAVSPTQWRRALPGRKRTRHPPAGKERHPWCEASLFPGGRSTWYRGTSSAGPCRSAPWSPGQNGRYGCCGR